MKIISKGFSDEGYYIIYTDVLPKIGIHILEEEFVTREDFKNKIREKIQEQIIIRKLGKQDKIKELMLKDIEDEEI